MIFLKKKRFRIAACLFTLILLFTAMPQPATAEGTQAQNLTAGAVMTLNGTEAGVSGIKDGAYTSKVSCKAGDTLNISADTEIWSIYLIFDRAPEKYTVESGGQIQACGLSGFLHEVVRPTTPSKEITITLPESILCDVSVYAKGTLPSSVQDWNAPYDDCDMLLLPTHADDEHIFFGGIMPYYAGEKGMKVQVAYLTNHWGEPYRPHELLNGLWEVGIRAYPIISEFPDYYSKALDHAKTLYDTNDVLAYEVELLRRFKPEVVIDHDINGEYGHGVHMLNTWILQQAVEQSGDAQYFPESARKYGTFDVQKTYLHLYPENELIMDVDTPLTAFGGKTAYEMAVSGFAKHTSQQKWFSVEKSGKYDCRKFGLYRTTVGPDSGIGDFFENVTFSDAPEPEPSEPEESGVESSESSQDESSELTDKENASISPLHLTLMIAGAAVLVALIVWFAARRNKKK